MEPRRTSVNPTGEAQPDPEKTKTLYYEWKTEENEKRAANQKNGRDDFSIKIFHQHTYPEE
jgi:DNA-dependent RNA polymerase auxiliary subunit epsilon